MWCIMYTIKNGFAKDLHLIVNLNVKMKTCNNGLSHIGGCFQHTGSSSDKNLKIKLKLR